MERIDMDIQALSSIEGFTATALLLTAVFCLVAIFTAWYTVRGRIQLSQVILGIFGYVVVRVLESLISTLTAGAGLAGTGLAAAVIFTLTVVSARELTRYAVTKLVLVDRFRDTDAAIGFGLGLAGLYLGVCAAYYFNCYSTVHAFLTSGSEAFFAEAGEDSQEVYELLLTISGQNGWQFLLTGVNRVMYLVREIALCVLVWYGFTDSGMKHWLILAPIFHAVAILPDGLFNAGMMTSTYTRDILIILLSGVIAYAAARLYNVREDQVAHFRLEKLRARRRR